MQETKLQPEALWQLVEESRDSLLAAKDNLGFERARLVTDAWVTHESEPRPLLRAKAFTKVLAEMTLDLDSNPVFAGNTSPRPREWMLIPEHGFGADAQVLLEHDGLDALWEGAPVPADLVEFWRERSFGGLCDVGHLAVDLSRVVHEGLGSFLTELAHFPADDSPEGVYRQAMKLSLEAVLAWAERYRQAALVRAAEEGDPTRRECLLRIAKALSQVPAKPARSLFEGLQSIALVHLASVLEGHAISLSVGLPDRILAPFITDDFDAEEATALIAAWMLKLTANSWNGRGSKTQAITVGGADATGKDRCNELTSCFLAAAGRLRVGDPQVFLRWHPKLPEAIKRQAAESLCSGHVMPLLIGDGPTAQGFIEAGCTPEDAWDYCVIGCNELGIPGRSCESAMALCGSVPYVRCLSETLTAHPDLDSIADMDALLGLYEQRLRASLGQLRKWGEAHRLRLAEECPTPFTSALMTGCIEQGKDLLVGEKYQLAGTYERGLTNAANALLALSELVFKERQISLSQVAEALRDDFSDEALRLLLHSRGRWGRDEETADVWALRLIELRERLLDELDVQYGRRHVVCHVVRSLHRLDGLHLAASPDGRRAGEPLSDSIGPALGVSPAGPTGLLASVLKLDAARYYRGGYNLNLTLDGAVASPEVVLALAEGFFTAGGQELQVQCLDPALLREAQQQPNLHQGLVVRIAGFCARFVDLSRTEQDELLARADAASAQT